MKDNVNHPPHYNQGIEVIDYIESWGLDSDAYLFNVIKYITRAKFKNNELEDLKKARWYLDRKIQNLESNAK
jgi:hypothetical protein